MAMAVAALGHHRADAGARTKARECVGDERIEPAHARQARQEGAFDEFQAARRAARQVQAFAELGQIPPRPQVLDPGVTPRQGAGRRPRHELGDAGAQHDADARRRHRDVLQVRAGMDPPEHGRADDEALPVVAVGEQAQGPLAQPEDDVHRPGRQKQLAPARPRRRPGPARGPNQLDERPQLGSGRAPDREGRVSCAHALAHCSRRKSWPWR
jgi:hypothetical protein